VAQKLKLKGIDRCEVLTGGYNAWRDHHFPLQEYYPELATIGKRSPFIGRSPGVPSNTGTS